jgi:tetratricopeptide (TPR) repeat protein
VIRRRFFENPDFAEYVRLLGRLHRLMRAHLDESDEGNALREQMDRPGEALSGEEIRAVKGIAADLASIGSHNGDSAAPRHPTHIEEITDAIAARDAIRALMILRDHAHETPLTANSYLRGRAFECVHQFEIAADYFELAKNSKPTDPSFGVAWLDALSRGEPERARTVSREILQHREEHPPTLVYKAADIRLEETYHLPDAEQALALTDLVSAFGDVIIGLETIEIPTAVRSSAYALRAICQRRLGATDDARHSLDRAIQLEPNSAEALLARGSLLYNIDRTQAVHDLRRAVELGSTLPFPYFFLAHNALIHEQFEDVLVFANTALRFDVSSGVRAYCLHWIAIAMASLDYPAPAVRAAFQEAVNLAPDEALIRENLAHFDEAVRESEAGRPTWAQTPVSRIQTLLPPQYQPMGVAA